jgi:hypothetical protein
MSFCIGQRTASTPSWVAHCVVAFVACNACGWLLSCFGGVTSLGLALTLPLVWGGLIVGWGLKRPQLPRRRWLSRWLRGPCGTLRFIWLAVASCALLGGLLHAPNNMDAMNYRLPKVAWWLMEGGWEWIPANNNSLNTRSSGMEWLYVPWIAWLRSDRLLFLLNFLPFLCLPGLVFSLLRHAGARRRTCHSWMWILPCGYGYALQAGGIGNDLPAAFFAMAAFDFGWRWKQGGQTRNAILALAAAACMTAVKPTTLPLGLPFLLLFAGMARTLLATPLRVAASSIPIALASFLPTATINHLHCGDWTGAKAENPLLGKVDPLIGLAGNLINAPLQNLVPPVFPLSEAWNSKVTTWFPPRFLEAMEANFEVRAARFGVTDIQGEESAGPRPRRLWFDRHLSNCLSCEKGSPLSPTGSSLTSYLWNRPAVLFQPRRDDNRGPPHSALLRLPCSAIPDGPRYGHPRAPKVVENPSRPLWCQHSHHAVDNPVSPDPSAHECLRGDPTHIPKPEMGTPRRRLPNLWQSR